MPTYIMLNHWTGQGIEHVKAAPERVAKAKEIASQMGCRTRDFYVLMGRYDTAFIVEAPDDATLAKFALALGAKGNVRTETMRAFTESEFAEMVEALPG